MSAEPKHHYSLSEYLELDQNSPEKYEYWNGELFCMSGGTLNHAKIAANILAFLTIRLREHGCTAVGSDLKVKLKSYAPYCYPDITVYCGPHELEKIGKQELLLNPILIIEVLSDSTAGLDHGDKFIALKDLPSFSEYLLVNQYKPVVTHYIKLSNGNWQRNDIVGLDGNLMLPSINCQLALSEIYQAIDFTTTT